MSGPSTRLARLRAALTDPARQDRTVLILLALYWVVWTAYGTMAKAPQGLHPDMTEIVAWSRDLALGYLKHPPFAAWLAAGWFELMPMAEWSYYALAMLMPVAALWIAWRLMGDYLDAEKRVAGLALLTLIPFFNFHALKYNVNTVLLPLWAATALWFLRSVRTRDALYAALAGAAAALSMYGKYWSVFLVAGLVAAAFWAPLLLPVLAAIAGKTEITSLWSMSAWTLLPVVLLSPSALNVRPIDTGRLLALAIALPLVMLVASPAIAWFTRDKAHPAEAQARLLAQEVDRDWKNLTPAPLRFVGGEASLVDGVVTWSADRPRSLTSTPAPPAAELARDGEAIVCFADNSGCKSDAAARAKDRPGSRVVESTILRAFFRSLGKPQGYTITLIPPAR